MPRLSHNIEWTQYQKQRISEMFWYIFISKFEKKKKERKAFVCCLSENHWLKKFSLKNLPTVKNTSQEQ